MLDQSIPSFRKFLASSGQAGGSPSLKQPSPLYLSNGCGARINGKITNKIRVHDEKPIKSSNGDEPVLSYKLQCYIRIPALRKAVTTHVKKIRYFFMCVWYRQSAADTSLAFTPLGQVDEWTAKPSPFSFQGRLPEFSRIMVAKTLKNPYSLQIVTFKLCIQWLW